MAMLNKQMVIVVFIGYKPTVGKKDWLIQGDYGFHSDYPLVMTNSLPWKITMLLIGKPSISMGHLYHGYVK